MINLSNLLDNLKCQISAKLPEHVNKVLGDSIEDLRLSKIGESALQTGDTLPSFALPDTQGTVIGSETLLHENDRLIIAFFRGSWCPYCNLELKVLQRILPQLKSKKNRISSDFTSNNRKKCRNVNRDSFRIRYTFGSE